MIRECRGFNYHRFIVWEYEGPPNIFLMIITGWEFIEDNASKHPHAATVFEFYFLFLLDSHYCPNFYLQISPTCSPAHNEMGKSSQFHGIWIRASIIQFEIAP